MLYLVRKRYDFGDLVDNYNFFKFYWANADEKGFSMSLEILRKHQGHLIEGIQYI